MSQESKPSKNILVVEDDQDFAALIAGILEGEGHMVRVAYDCDEALDEVKAQTPDLITLDLQMPPTKKKSGLHFYRQIKSSDAHRHLPVIVITGVMQNDPDMENLVRAVHEVEHVLPPNAYIDKPFDNQDLLTVVRESLAGD